MAEEPMKAFKICYVSSEVDPFAATDTNTRLADTSNALPIALKEMEQDIRLMMPKYKSINERKYVLREVIRLREVKVELANQTKTANGKTAFLPNSKVHVYFLSVPEHFDRKGFYADPQTGEVYPDNAERFAYFCKGVFETLKLLYWQPDIIHCNDWGTALIPFYLKTHYQNDEFFQNTHTLLTVHNFSEQGIFPLETAARIGIGEEFIAPGKEFELKGSLNLLKGGLLFADVINTVGEKYAEMIISDPKAAPGLREVIAARQKDIFGILNGTDYSTWNPETDKNLSANYDLKTLGNKGANKKELYRELNLENDASLPLIALVGELSEANGTGLVLESINNLMKLKAQWMVMDTGESPYHEFFKKLAGEYPGKLVFLERWDTRLAHLILASADMLLLPAKGEPRQAFHLESLRYGTVPVVREVNELAECIGNFEPDSGKGNGFTFSAFKKSELVNTLQAALKLYPDRKTWAKIQRNGMRGDFSWQATAKKYLKLYERAARKK